MASIMTGRRRRRSALSRIRNSLRRESSRTSCWQKMNCFIRHSGRPISARLLSRKDSIRGFTGGSCLPAFGPILQRSENAKRELSGHLPETTEKVCPRCPPTSAADQVRHLPQTMKVVCRRCRPPSRAAVFSPLPAF